MTDLEALDRRGEFHAGLIADILNHVRELEEAVEDLGERVFGAGRSLVRESGNLLLQHLP